MRQLKREKAATQLKDMAETWKERVMTSRFQAWVAFMRSLQKDAGAYKVMVAWRRMKRAMILAGFRVRGHGGAALLHLLTSPALHPCRTCSSSASGWR